MLDVIESMARRPPDESDIPALAEAHEFLKVFVDGCHHHKEEQFLFPALRRAGIEAAVEPITLLLEDHVRGRSLTHLLGAHVERASAGEALALGGAGGLLGEYARLLRAHIEREEFTVFALADASLSSAVNVDLAEGYDAVEREVIGEGRHEEFHAMLDRLEAAYLPR